MKLSFLSVALALTFVNAASSVKTKGLSWHELADKAYADGYLEENPARMFTAPAGAVMKDLSADPEETADGQDHICALTLESKVASAKRLDFILSAAGPGLFKSESDERYFQTDLDGKLVKAIFARVKLDEKGERILASGITEEQDIDSPRIKELFQKEVDFWLKGMYRKKTAAKSALKK